MDARITSICNTMRGFIISARAEIDRKRERIIRLNRLIATMKAQPNPDADAIALLKQEKQTLEDELPVDVGQLNAMEEEFSAECGHLPL